jgi:hypothetical protein
VGGVGWERVIFKEALIYLRINTPVISFVLYMFCQHCLKGVKKQDITESACVSKQHFVALCETGNETFVLLRDKTETKRK